MARAVLLGLLLLSLLLPVPVLAAQPSPQAVAPLSRYVCDGDPLLARADDGPVDATGIPNMVAGTPPGAFVVLQWRELNLQLPRTNNAGAPSYTDGRWWWSLEDAERPRLRQRLAFGQVQDYACQRP